LHENLGNFALDKQNECFPTEFLQRTTKGPAVVVYHGGGWVFGNLGKPC